MPSYAIRPVDSRHWDDLETVLSGGGDGRSCQCMWPVLPSREWDATSVEQRRGMLRAEVVSASPVSAPPGLLAYDGDEPVGWVRVGPRPPLRRLIASRIVKTGSGEPPDDEAVWAVSCFSVRREHRGRGVAVALLGAAVDHARASGARVLEAYPYDLAAGSRSSNELFRGSVSTFEAAGFRVVAHPTPARAVVALELAAPSCESAESE